MAGGGKAKARTASGESTENAGLEAGNARRCHLDEFMFSFSHVDVKLKIKH